MNSSILLNRRQLLRLCLGLPMAAALAAGASSVVQGAPPAVRQGAIKAGRLAATAAELVADYAGELEQVDGSLGAAAGRIGLGLSKQFSAPIPFHAVGIHWLPQVGGELTFWLRTSVDGNYWSEWHRVGQENSAPAPADGRIHSTLVFTNADELHQFVQCRLELRGGDTGLQLADVGFDFIDATGGTARPAGVEASAAQAMAGGLALGDKPSVVSRTAWGCPDGQNSPEWLPEYFPASHVIIHHTATPNNESDWYARVRSFWFYHADTLGWGDVGYNFMIDPTGVTYEGRAGANASGHSEDDVEAGHCYSYNRYTAGLAIIGDYRTAAPTAISVDAAERLMTWKFTQRNLGPKDSGPIVRACDQATVSMPRIAGHTDYGSQGWGANVCPGYSSPRTDCPGAMLENLLPAMRDATAAISPHFAVWLNGISIGPSLVAVGSRLTVTVTIQNIGTTTLSSGAPDTSYVYEEGYRTGSGAYNTFRIGLDYEGRDPGIDPYPYRWGIGGDLPPGASRTIQLAVNVRNESVRQYWVGLVQEGVGIQVDRQGTTRIQARVKHGDICLANVRVGPPVVFSGNVLEFYAEVENWTSQTLQTQGPNPGYIYNEGEVSSADAASAYRIGLDYSSHPSTVKDHPYRWGLGGAVPPLTVLAVKGYVRLPAPRSATDFWIGFVKEQDRWVQDWLGRTSITVKNPAARNFLPYVRK